MIVRVFSSGTSRGESPVNYLLSKTDHTGQQRDAEPEVLAGQPSTTVDCINSIGRKHKYVSGAIAFKDTERPTNDQLQAVIRAFKPTMCPGCPRRSKSDPPCRSNSDPGWALTV